MGFLSNIFGGGDTNIWTVVFALIVVVVLIIAGVWALKLVFRASGSIVRGRQRRLAIIDSMAIDPKRQLILIRRDDVEHLVITASTGDVVVETGIPVPEPEPRSVSRKQDEPRSGRAQPTLERASAAAQRLGLSSILRRKNAETDDKTPDQSEKEIKKPDPEIRANPIDRLRNMGSSSVNRDPKSLRHTGLLRPVSEMESVNLGADGDKFTPENNDSVMNKSNEVDASAMESIEEGTSPESDETKVRTHNDNQEVNNKNG